MPGRTVTSIALASFMLGLAACQAEPDKGAPETAATMPERAVQTGQGPEPSVGAPPPAGGGIPGSSDGNPAAALPETTPPAKNDTPQ